MRLKQDQINILSKCEIKKNIIYLKLELGKKQYLNIVEGLSNEDLVNALMSKRHLTTDGYSVKILSKEYKSIFGNYFYAEWICIFYSGLKKRCFGKIRKRKLMDFNNNK